jgi:soluble lytic murein transglycosylase-like protein
LNTPQRLLLLATCLAALLPAARANTGGIYAYVDDEGIEHLSNIPDDRRYRLLLADRLAPAQAALRSPRGVFALPFGQRPFHDSVLRASASTGVDAALLHAVISVESGYRQGAVSAKGATGLMQLLPGTARRYGTVNLLDPAENIGAGARYLRDLLAMFDNNLELALAAYNAGENAVIRHGRRLPPYAETRRYVPLVLAHYQKLGGQ